MWSVMIMRSTMRLVGKLYLLIWQRARHERHHREISTPGKEKGEGESLLPAFFELNNTSPGAPSNQSLWLRLHLLKLQQ